MKTKEELCALKEEVKELNKYRIKKCKGKDIAEDVTFFVLLRIKR